MCDDDLPAAFGLDSMREASSDYAGGDGSALELLAKFSVVADPCAAGGVTVFAAFPLVLLPD